MERTLPEKKNRKFEHTSRGCPFFLEILQISAVPFATGTCRKFKADVLGEWKLKHPRSLASELSKGRKKKANYIIFGFKRKTCKLVKSCS